ncbi:protein HID1 [Ixodes scapularis]
MGNADSKLNFRKAVIQLTTKTQPIDAKDEAFWEQFWSEGVQGAQDVFALIPAAEIRSLREEAPSNLATLCYKAVERLVRAADSLCNTAAQQQTVLNCVRLLTRLLPYIFEDSDWRGFFWSSLPGQGANQDEQDSQAENLSLAQSLITALCDTRPQEAGAKVVCCLARGAPKGPSLPRARLNHQDPLFPEHGLATHRQTLVGLTHFLLRVRNVANAAGVRGVATHQAPKAHAPPAGLGVRGDASLQTPSCFHSSPIFSQSSH